MALMEYRQTPIRETGRTPAKMMLGRELRDLIQVKDTLDPGRYLIQETYQMKSEDRERAYTAKYLKENDRWAEHTKQQTPLNVGDPVFCQSMRGKDIGKWTTTGTIHRADQTNSTYQVRMDGTNRLAKRNRINLRKIEPHLAKRFMEINEEEERDQTDAPDAQVGEPGATQEKTSVRDFNRQFFPQKF